MNYLHIARRKLELIRNSSNSTDSDQITSNQDLVGGLPDTGDNRFVAIESTDLIHTDDEDRPDKVNYTFVDEWENTIEPPSPCSKCGSLELWQSLKGIWHCIKCDPPLVAQRIREALRRIQDRCAN